MAYTGYIRLHRRLLDNPLIKKPLYCHLWNTLLLLAQHKPSEFIFAGERRRLLPGQFLTGRKKLAEISGISESQVERILKYLENAQQIQQDKTNKYRIITIVRWDSYQGNSSNDTTSEQQKDNKRTTKGQQKDTYKNVKNEKNEKKKNVRLFEPDSPQMKMSSLLFSLMREHNPGYKAPDLQVWAQHVDRLIRLDGKTPSEIEAVIRWAQADDFWHRNILCADKLRKQYDKLLTGLLASKGRANERTTKNQRNTNFTFEGKDPDSVEISA